MCQELWLAARLFALDQKLTGHQMVVVGVAVPLADENLAGYQGNEFGRRVQGGQILLGDGAEEGGGFQPVAGGFGRGHHSDGRMFKDNVLVVGDAAGGMAYATAALESAPYSCAT